VVIPKEKKMPKKLVFNAKNVVGFSPQGYEGSFVSRMLIDHESVGSERLVMNHFTLKSGGKTDPGSHPSPFDEIYYVLRGHGKLYLGLSSEPFPLDADSVAFIPAGTDHYLINDGIADLEMITVMPGPLTQGANSLYDERRETWGTSFKLTGSGQSG
jgi:mannose-6-phosphate isomerase-like protein (cupin superfamily)